MYKSPVLKRQMYKRWANEKKPGKTRLAGLIEMNLFVFLVSRTKRNEVSVRETGTEEINDYL
jgi:hypothetical protein